MLPVTTVSKSHRTAPNSKHSAIDFASAKREMSLQDINTICESIFTTLKAHQSILNHWVRSALCLANPLAKALWACCFSNFCGVSAQYTAENKAIQSSSDGLRGPSKSICSRWRPGVGILEIVRCWPKWWAAATMWSFWFGCCDNCDNCFTCTWHLAILLVRPLPASEAKQ